MAEFEPLVTVRTTAAAPIEAVWRAATEKTGAMFMGADVDTDWRVGRPITFKGEWKGKRFEDHGEVTRFEPTRRLAFTHFSPMSGKPGAPENYNLVEIELAPAGDGTQITLTRSIRAGAPRPGEAQLGEYEKNWQAMVGRLAEAAKA